MIMSTMITSFALAATPRAVLPCCSTSFTGNKILKRIGFKISLCIISDFRIIFFILFFYMIYMIILTLSLGVRSTPAFRSVSMTSALPRSAERCRAVWSLYGTQYSLGNISRFISLMNFGLTSFQGFHTACKSLRHD